MPAPIPWGSTGLSIGTSVSPHTGLKYFTTYDSSCGNRAVQYKIDFINNAVPPEAFTGSMVVLLSHNADGSNPGTTSDGSTTDHTASYPVGSFTSIFGGGLNQPYTTGWINAGAISPTLGTFSAFKGSLDLSGVASLNTNAVSVIFRLSPRMDVPYPVTLTGRGDLIAPGGYV